MRNYRQLLGKPEYLVSPGTDSDTQNDEPVRTMGSNKLFPQGHIQVLHCHLHTIYIQPHSMYHLYWIIFTVKLYYYGPEDGHFLIYSSLYFFPHLNVIGPEDISCQK